MILIKMMRTIFILMLFSLLLSACNGNGKSSAEKAETVSWYNQQKEQGWSKKQNGGLLLMSENYHVIDGKPIALAFNVINSEGYYIASLMLTDVSKNVETEGEHCPSLDRDYPRVGMVFDGEALQWTSERPTGSSVALCYNKDVDTLLTKLFETHSFKTTVRLSDGTNLEYKFSPYLKK